MKDNNSAALPRLVIEKSKRSPERQIGFLELHNDSEKKILVGSADSREFLLMQCLFSPKNFLSAKYAPVVQTHERVFGAIRVSTDVLNERLTDRETVDSEMTAIVEQSLSVLQKGKVGEHFSFISQEGKVYMARV